MTFDTVHSLLVYLSDSLFVGLRIAVPALFLAWVFGPERWRDRLGGLNAVAARLLIAGGAMFLLVVSSHLFRVWYFDNETEKAFLEAMAAGPTAYQVYLPLVNYAFLPVLLWFGRLRRSMYVPFLIVVCWILSWIWTGYLNRVVAHAVTGHEAIDWLEYFGKGSLFVLLFALGAWFGIFRKR